jgi:Protein kinase domain
LLLSSVAIGCFSVLVIKYSARKYKKGKGLERVGISLSTMSSLPYSLLKLYTVLYQIGSGANGTVVAAVRITDGLIVAIKTFKSDKVARWGTDICGTQIPMEIYILKNFSHKCIVRYIDHIRYGDYFHLIMTHDTVAESLVNIPIDKSHCRDLWDFLDTNDITEDGAKNIFMQIAHTVKFLHGRGICHGDIKDQVRWYIFIIVKEIRLMHRLRLEYHDRRRVEDQADRFWRGNARGRNSKHGLPWYLRLCTT